MKLYLIRHGQPEVKTYKGFPGPALGVEGVAQANKIAHFLQSKDIQQIFASDYKRVAQTLAPFHSLNPNIKVIKQLELRERENETESHVSLEERVHFWFKANQLAIFKKNTAIFSHCGPINMILTYLDPNKQLLDYPFTDAFGCHTPIGCLWELEFNINTVRGFLIQDFI